MKRTVLPQPPNPDNPAFRGNTLTYMRALFAWCNQIKGQIEDASRVNDVPSGQAISASGFTTNTTLTGTMTGSDLANALCTLVAVLQQKGVTSPSVQRTST